MQAAQLRERLCWQLVGRQIRWAGSGYGRISIVVAIGKRWALFLLARINKWDSIAFLIQSLTDQNDSCVELSQRYIVRWFARYNRSFVTPTAEQLSRLRNVLSRCNLLLSSGTQRQLDSLLKSF